MWKTDTFWFDAAVVMSIFAVGSILLGHFEEHKSKLRRVLKVAIVLAVTVTLSWAGLRWLAYGLLGLMGLGAAHVHLWWLPSHGINGWTGEPKAKYYELLESPECDQRGDSFLDLPSVSKVMSPVARSKRCN